MSMCNKDSGKHSDIKIWESDLTVHCFDTKKKAIFFLPYLRDIVSWHLLNTKDGTVMKILDNTSVQPRRGSSLPIMLTILFTCNEIENIYSQF